MALRGAARPVGGRDAPTGDRAGRRPAAAAYSNEDGVNGAAMHRRFERVEGSSNEFWEITLEGCAVRTRDGRIGDEGRTTTKAEAGPVEARSLFEALVDEKTKTGYVEVTAAGGAAPEGAEAVYGASRAATKKADRTTTRSSTSSAPRGLLTPLKERNLLARLSGGDVTEAYQALVKASPGRHDVALFSDLVTRRALGWEHGPLLASLVRYARHGEPALLFSWLSSLPPPSALLAGTCDGGPLEDFVLEDVPLRLFCGVREAWRRAPGVFDPDAPGAPTYLRDTILLARAEAGEAPSSEDRERLVAKLAKNATRLGAVPGGFEGVRHATSWFARLLGATRDTFGERVLLEAREGASENLLSALAWYEPNPDRSSSITFATSALSIPIRSLAQAITTGLRQGVGVVEHDEDGFARGRTSHGGLGLFVVLALLDARRDRGEELHTLADELLAAANGLTERHAREVREVADGVVLVAHERAPGARPVDVPWLLRAGASHLLAERVSGLLPRADTSVREAVAEHDEEHPQYGFARRFALVARAIGTLADAARRVDALVRRPRDRFGGDMLVSMGRVLSSAMPGALEVLLAARPSAGDEAGLRRHAWLALGALAAHVGAGGGVPDACDVDLGPSTLAGQSDCRGELAHADVRAAYGDVLGAMPSQRRRAILGAWIEADATGALGIREWLAALPARVQADSPNAPSTRELVARLARASGRRAATTIYLLERAGADDTHPTLRAAASSIRGLDPSRVPTRRGTPLEHVITFDFEHLPAMRAVMNASHDGPAFSDSAAGVAFFVRSGGAWSPDNDDVVLVPLTRDELAAGHEGGVTFRASAVEVPAETFVSATRRSDPALQRLWDALSLAPGIALGAGRYIQGETDTYGVEESFVFDADARLVPIDMGDAGVFHGFAFGGYLESC